jgi:hypothetical protein
MPTNIWKHYRFFYGPVGPLWTSDLPDTETIPDNTQNSQEKDSHAPSKIRASNFSKQAVAHPHLGLCGHWDRSLVNLFYSSIQKYKHAIIHDYKCSRGSEIWCRTLKEEHKLIPFNNSIQRKIFEPKWWK